MEFINRFLETVQGLSLSLWWIAIIIGAFIVILLLARRFEGGPLGRLFSPFIWYLNSKWIRQLTLNIIGVLLIIWVAKSFSAWVQPTLTPDMLFTPPVVGPQPVKVEMIEMGEVSHVVTYTGSVKPFEDVTIFARVEGFVKDLNVYQGDRVKKGQILATLETSELEPPLEHARAELTFYKAEFERDKRLFDAGAISATEFEAAKRKFEIAKARVKLRETKIDYATIRAPISGWIADRKVYPGVYAKKGTPLLRIDRLEKVRIQFDVAEKDLPFIKRGTPVTLTFPQMDRLAFERAGWGEQLLPDIRVPSIRSRVSVIFPTEDPASRTGIVEVHLTNIGAILKTNTYVVGRIIRDRVETALKVPASALMLKPGGKTALFIGPAFADQGAAEIREVKVGVRGERYVQVIEGVEAGEFVIYEGHRGVVDGENVMVVHREGGF